MPRHLQREINNLRQKILTLSTVVEESVYLSVKSFMERDADLAAKIINKDQEVDLIEIEVEEECLKILALHQPVAVDLRYIIAALKLNNDLERIGDMAVKIAERTVNISRHNVQEVPIDFSSMAEKVKLMLKKSLDALVHMNSGLATEVCIADDEVDELHRNTYMVVKNQVSAHPEHISVLLDFLSVSGCLERIADHTTNIAEDIIYMIEGEIIRHSKIREKS
ncbi:MAG: phosphate transport system regulatory protein PhoU [Candidatus Melainabacteria bacterium GWF2_32_7]|nr:MAG: phosphate transport system regulatory protein PhoU [Candidatus Melainabacteria bacterium GWF2_32_7]